MSQNRKPSVYLLERVQVFDQTITFFEQSNVRRMIFLAQIDFWEWEMDTLIFSFQTFEERSKAWLEDIQPLLLKQGILAKHKLTKDTTYDNAWRGGQRQVIAPIPELNKCVDHWNHFLDVLESKCLRKDSGEMAKLNKNFVADLSKYRKANL